MSIDEHPLGRTAVCGTCSHRNEPDDRYCTRCGSAVHELLGRQTGGPEGHRPEQAPVDGTTRYLCAAAHLDATYADAAIAEHLVERTRAIAPAPGVDSATVLRDAVAARARRRLRDAVLVVLLIAIFVVSPPTGIGWIVIGIVAAALTPRERDRSRWRMIAAGVLAAVVLYLLVTAGAAYLLITGFDVLPGSATGLVVLLLLGAAVLVVCLVDEAVVDALVRNRFRPRTFRPATAVPGGWERTVRMLDTGRWETDLDRVARAEEQRRASGDRADVVVYRGRLPFVGSGRIEDDQVVALPLTPGTGPDGTRAQPRPFAASELQDHVARAVDELRDSGSLSPARRLATMAIREQLLVPAERLLANLHRRPDPPVLPGLDRPPVPHLPADRVRQLADRPEEWARYYRCFRIEAWDRDLATTTYFAAGVDSRMLYLEWTHCLLRPLKDQYRDIDRTPRAGPVLRALGTAITLPVTVFERLARIVHRFRPLPQRPGEVVPDRYGAGTTLRELAADAYTQDYFQDADAVRYTRVVERAVLRAVGRFLEERGYSVVDFMEAAKASIITNNSISVSGGNFAGGTALGIGAVNQQTDSRTTSPSGRNGQQP